MQLGEALLARVREASRPAKLAERKGPAVGFKTAMGSLYSFDAQGRTVRTKLSEGRGQGQTHSPHEALFVSDAGAAVLQQVQFEREMAYDPMDVPRVRFGYQLPNRSIQPVETLVDIPDGTCPLIVVINRKSGQVAHLVAGKYAPAAGLHPYEISRLPDGTSTHLGNRITEVYGREVQPALPARNAQEAPALGM